MNNLVRIPRVYIAGPFSAKMPEWARFLPAFLRERLRRFLVSRNVRRAESVGVEVARLGCYPVIPHANTQDPRFEEVQPYEWWIRTTMESLHTCDAVLMMDGWRTSYGARGEYDEAIQLGMRVFHENGGLWWMIPKWIEELGEVP